jgi:hypothetical protein
MRMGGECGGFDGEFKDTCHLEASLRAGTFNAEFSHARFREAGRAGLRAEGEFEAWKAKRRAEGRRSTRAGMTLINIDH